MFVCRHNLKKLIHMLKGTIKNKNRTTSPIKNAKNYFVLGIMEWNAAEEHGV